MIANYAAKPELSRGRRFPEPAPLYRSEFQRDRDRIIHSKAFRRLEYKTQVFVNHEGDLYRTRLTHSLEVAQVACAVARNMGLNEDLTEAIALAHDLGHTPFGHAGQDALNGCMKLFGGFEHNLQSLRVVDHLETSYAEFDGLNLTFETREGILKHCAVKNAAMLGDVGERFLTKTQPSLEAQIANLADEIAYNNHDIDDGIRSGLISIEQFCAVPLFCETYEEVIARYPKLEERRLIHEIVRRLIGKMVIDLTDTSTQMIQQSGVNSIDQVRQQSSPLIRYSSELLMQKNALKSFLYQNLYMHPTVYRMAWKAQKIISSLFTIYMQDIKLLPVKYQDFIKSMPNDETYKARVIADYIAGMTDRYAMKEYGQFHDLSRLH
ncbi:MAG: deoxyguanosinetriphosphate triphosphohydrolase [Thiofilum sp.]|uniref:deoxyguanosinetriphosphate triphosphohydrolase n=1 Tax=Thiofilum sp. TaxID=2212733 RepID=UPI0025D90780|nr:deoxyguanosinetriphosphate triphosphohydrolase [Thiofilum sp.]MBK8453481.1 deoxyguanosinetriphosphate triphosphohydrolase [Thiofilum sp.]